MKLPNKAKLQAVPSYLDATYLAVAMEGAGSTLGARSVRMALDSEEHYYTRAWQVHRFSGTPSRRWGILPIEVGAICPTYADAQILLETRVLERARVANTLVASSDLSQLRAGRFRWPPRSTLAGWRHGRGCLEVLEPIICLIQAPGRLRRTGRGVGAFK